MATINVGPLRSEDEICDFCSNPNVVTSYACISFDISKIEGVVLASEGAWVACQACKELIDAEKWEELTERGTESVMTRFFPAGCGVSRSSLREMVYRLHQKFRSSRKQTH